MITEQERNSIKNIFEDILEDALRWKEGKLKGKFIRDSVFLEKFQKEYFIELDNLPTEEIIQVQEPTAEEKAEMQKRNEEITRQRKEREEQEAKEKIEQDLKKEAKRKEGEAYQEKLKKQFEERKAREECFSDSPEFWVKHRV